MSKHTSTRSRREVTREQNLRAMGVRAWIANKTAAAERKRAERRKARDKAEAEQAQDERPVEYVVENFGPNYAHRRQTRLYYGSAPTAINVPHWSGKDRTLAGKKRIRARRAAAA